MSRQTFVLALCLSALVVMGSGLSAPRAAETTLSDDTRSLLHRAMTAAFIQDSDAILDCYDRLTRLEFVRPDASRARLSDNVYALLAARSQDRDTRLKTCHDILDLADDDYAKSVATNALNSDELLHARRLLRANLYNHFVGLFNYVSGNVARFVNGNSQAALQVFIDALFSFRRLGRLSPGERESLALLQQFSDKYPLSPAHDWVERKTARLDTKLKKKNLEENLMIAETYLKEGDPQSALFFLDRAQERRPDSEQAKRLHLAAHAAVSRAERAVVASATVWEDPDVLHAGNRHARYRDALERVVSGSSETNPEATASVAAAVDADESDSWLRPRPLNAKRYLVDRYDEGRADVRREKVRYLALGERSGEDRLYIISSGIVQGAYDALEGLGVFFVFDAALRGITLAVASPVPEDRAIDAGARYVRRFPDTAESQQICADIAARYERARDYDNAITYYTLSGTVSARKLNALTEKAAKQFLHQIREVQESERRIHYLNALIERYPKTKAAETAKREISALKESLEVAYTFSKADLRVCPRLLSNGALAVSAELVDGAAANGEIDDAGVQVLRDGIAVYRLQGEKRRCEIILDSARKMELDSLHSDLQYLQRTRSTMQKLRQRQFVPIELSGSVGGQGVLAYPTLKEIPPESEEE